MAIARERRAGNQVLYCTNSLNAKARLVRTSDAVLTAMNLYIFVYLYMYVFIYLHIASYDLLN
jgi:hypothetical protein